MTRGVSKWIHERTNKNYVPAPRQSVTAKRKQTHHYHRNSVETGKNVP
jgi:hypothetical protein